MVPSVMILWLVQFGFHQDSMLSHLLFIIVQVALSRGNRSGCPGELIIASYGLILAFESL